MPKRPDLAEIGTTGLRRTGGTVYEEFLVSLRGRRGAKVYREMSENDPVVGSILYAIEKIILRLELDNYSSQATKMKTGRQQSLLSSAFMT
jgi:hypothetical protein